MSKELNKKVAEKEGLKAQEAKVQEFSDDELDRVAGGVASDGGSVNGNPYIGGRDHNKL